MGSTDLQMCVSTCFVLGQSAKKVFFKSVNLIFLIQILFLSVLGLCCHVGFPLGVPAGGYSCLQYASFHCGGLSCGAQAPATRSSGVAAHRLSSCGAQAQLLLGRWNLLGPGIQPESLALAGRFLSTAPPEKSKPVTFNNFRDSIESSVFGLRHSSPVLDQITCTSSYIIEFFLPGVTLATYCFHSFIIHFGVPQ